MVEEGQDMRSRTHAATATLLIALGILILIALVSAWPAGRRNLIHARSALYALARARGRADFAESLANWREADSAHFIVRYQAPDADVVNLILETAEESRIRVTRDFGYAPTEKTLIAVYPTREALRDSFGWPASQSAVGVYWAGAIRLLSPHAWATAASQEELALEFRSGGPLVHEYTHLVLDYLTDGNYPRWFTEGLAQWEEYRVTGYVWNDPDGDLTGRDVDALYSVHELESEFDSLDNQALAYRQSLSLVTYLAKDDDGAKIKAVIGKLAEHYELKSAIRAVYGQSLDQLERGWLAWVERNPYPWK